MRWLARLRLVNARHPWVRWCVVGAVALVVAASVAGKVADLDQQRRSWGALRPVLVATRDLAPGQTLTGDDVTVDERPDAVIPRGALDDVSQVADGVRTWQWVSAGEVLVTRDLAGDASVAERLPPGTRGVVVSSAGVPVSVGDVVEVVVDARRVAEASVVEVLPTRNDVLGGDTASRPLLVAVPVAAAPSVASAAVEGRVTVVLTEVTRQRQPATSTTTISDANPSR